MKKRVINFDAIFALISLFSLYYIRLYEQRLYYRPNPFFDFLYLYIAIPCFFFFVAAAVVTVAINLFGIGIAPSLQKVFMTTVGVAFLLYMLLALAKLAGFGAMVYPGFISAYSVAAVVLGGIFALATKK